MRIHCLPNATASSCVRAYRRVGVQESEQYPVGDRGGAPRASDTAFPTQGDKEPVLGTPERLRHECGQDSHAEASRYSRRSWNDTPKRTNPFVRMAERPPVVSSGTYGNGEKTPHGKNIVAQLTRQRKVG